MAGVKKIDLILEHYKNVTPVYDRFYRSRYNGLAVQIVQKLSLQPEDSLVDFGAGTGGVTHLCWKKAGLIKPALAVDPSKESLDVASKLEGVDVMCATSEEFVESNKIDAYKNFVFCRSFHHIADQEAFLRRFYERASFGSKLMIIEQLEDILWDNARKLCRSEPFANVESLLCNVGFTVTQCNDEHENTICNKEEYFESLRCRVYSVLELFSDEEIEKGLESWIEITSNIKTLLNSQLLHNLQLPPKHNIKHGLLFI